MRCPRLNVPCEDLGICPHKTAPEKGFKCQMEMSSSEEIDFYKRGAVEADTELKKLSGEIEQLKNTIQHVLTCGIWDFPDPENDARGSIRGWAIRELAQSIGYTF